MSGVLCTGAHFGEVEFHPVESGFSRAVPVFSRLVYSFWFTLGFFGFLGDLDETWDLHPLVCIVHSGLLIRTKGVLQGISGGALWVVR